MNFKNVKQNQFFLIYLRSIESYKCVKISNFHSVHQSLKHLPKFYVF